MSKDTRKSKKVGFTCGTMDLFHAGHVLMLKEARAQCEWLILGLQTDPTLDRLEKNKPIQSLEERLVQAEGCRYVDQVVVYETEAQLVELLENLKPNVRFIGADWEGKTYTGHELPIEVIFNSRDHGYSSSDLRARVYRAEAQKHGVQVNQGERARSFESS